MFKFCPQCASPDIRFERNRVFRCPQCGFVYYHNVATATACIIENGREIAFLVRAKEPGFGKLDLPGGFVDPDEGAVEGLRRECREELGWETGENLSFFASFPNTYPYKNIVYKTCDLCFSVFAPDLKAEDFNIDLSENSAVRFVKFSDINFDDIAFDSLKRAVKSFLEKKI